MSAASQYYRVTARVGVPHRHGVEVTIPAVGPAGPTGPQGPKGDPGEVSGSIAWDNITDKPSTFAPSSHTHAINEVTSLQTALDGKAATSHTHTSAAITDFAAAVVAAAPPTTDASLLTSGTLADARLSSAVTASLAKADSASQPGHTHVAANVTDFNTAAAAAAPVQSVAGRTGAVTLAVADVANAVATNDARLSDARAPLAHTHAISEVTGLQSALDGKAATSHTHPAADISDSTTAGRALLTAADASAQRTTLGLGNSATLDTGTTAGTVAEGNHTHTDLHTRSHAITSTSDHTAGNHKVFYSDGSGNITELALGNSGEVLTSNGATSPPSFAAASGGISAVGASAADVFSVGGTGNSELVADDAGSDKLVAWDDSASKIVYFDIDEIEKQPNQIDDCVVWLRSDDVVTDVRSSVTYVTTMNNKVNSSLNAVQTVDTTKQPTLSTNQINGHAAVVWDGSNDCLQIASLSLFAQITVFLVCKPDASGGFFVEHSADAGSNEGFYFYGSTNNAAQVRRSSANFSIVGRTSWSGTAWNIFALKTQGIVGNWMIRRGKIGEETGSASTTGPSNTSASATLNIGARNNGAAGAEAQQLAELIIYNRAIDEAEYAHVYKYLSNRYAL